MSECKKETEDEKRVRLLKLFFNLFPKHDDFSQLPLYIYDNESAHKQAKLKEFVKDGFLLPDLSRMISLLWLGTGFQLYITASSLFEEDKIVSSGLSDSCVFALNDIRHKVVEAREYNRIHDVAGYTRIFTENLIKGTRAFKSGERVYHIYIDLLYNYNVGGERRIFSDRDYELFRSFLYELISEKKDAYDLIIPCWCAGDEVMRSFLAYNSYIKREFVLYLCVKWDSNTCMENIELYDKEVIDQKIKPAKISKYTLLPKELVQLICSFGF